MAEILNNTGDVFFYTNTNGITDLRMPVFNGKYKMNVYLCIGVRHILCDSYGAMFGFVDCLLPRLGSYGAGFCKMLY